MLVECPRKLPPLQISFKSSHPGHPLIRRIQVQTLNSHSHAPSHHIIILFIRQSSPSCSDTFIIHHYPPPSSILEASPKPTQISPIPLFVKPFLYLLFLIFVYNTSGWRFQPKNQSQEKEHEYQKKTIHL